MSDSPGGSSPGPGSGDAAEFHSELKYRQFASAVERALKSFELSSEWPDLISSLARLNKVRTARYAMMT